jgi:hypothetical protein
VSGEKFFEKGERKNELKDINLSIEIYFKLFFVVVVVSFSERSCSTRIAHGGVQAHSWWRRPAPTPRLAHVTTAQITNE